MHRYKNVEKLAAYKPVPLSAAANAPQTLIVWAQDGARIWRRTPSLILPTRKMILEVLNDGS
ncbi:conidial yellow pigment biosynthesis polyketide synthase [Penicillium canescens]|nr:conidial yellow pigment biosynthesis polyketide synthase [Penicillium canescens]